MKYDLLPLAITHYYDDDINDYIEIRLAAAGITHLPKRHFLLTTTSRSVAIIPPIDTSNSSKNLRLWRKFFKGAFIEALRTLYPDKTVVCPCMVNNSYWIAVIIAVTPTEAEITIYDPTQNRAFSQTVVGSLLESVVPEKHKVKKPLQYFCPDRRYELYETGIVVAEYITQFILNPSSPNISEDATALKTKQIELMATLPLRANEKHYGRTNFLARHTTLTRSILLNKFLEKCEPLELDYSKTAFILVQHLIPQTVELIKGLVMCCHAQPKNIFLLGKLYSTEPQTLCRLRQMGINLIETNVGDYERYPHFADKFLEDISRLLEEVVKKICVTPTANVDKIIILDDGGRCITKFMLDYEHAPNIDTAALSPAAKTLLRYCCDQKIKVAAVEQTSAGSDLEADALIGTGSGKLLPFSVVMMASSVTKKLFEPVLISGQLWEKLQSVIFAEIPVTESKHSTSTGTPCLIRIGIIGYGKIGKAVVRKIKTRKDIQLFIYDSDETTGEAVKDFATFCSTPEDLMARSRYIIGCTGRDVFANRQLDHLPILITESKIFISCSSENKEFFAIIQWLNASQLITQVDPNPLSTIKATVGAHQIEILYGGCPFNFSGHTPGVYFQDIQSTLCLLFGGILQAHYLAAPIDTICEGRGLSQLAVYDPFIQQTIIQLSIENIESLQRIFDPQQPKAAVDPEDLKFMRETLNHLATDTTTALSIYEFSQNGINAEDSQKVPLGTAWQIPIISEKFTVTDFMIRCSRWLSTLETKYSLPQQQMVLAMDSTVRTDIRIGIKLCKDSKGSFMFLEIQLPAEPLRPDFFQRAPGYRRLRIALSTPTNVTPSPNISELSEVIADPKHLNPERVHFWTTAAHTVRSLTELSPHIDAMIKQLGVDFPLDNLILMIEVAIRFCSFYYRMGCINPAITFITYAEQLIEKARSRLPQTEKQKQQLQDHEDSIAKIHWFNICLLKYEYKKCNTALEETVKEILTKKEKWLADKFISRLLPSSWVACEKLAAWHSSQEEFPEAITLYCQSIELIDKEIARLEATGNVKDKAKAGAYKYYRANTQLDLGELYITDEHSHKKAEELFHQAAACYKTIVTRDLSLDEALEVWKLGKLYAKLEKTTEAAHYLQSSLTMLTALSLDRLGSIFVTQIKQDIAQVRTIDTLEEVPKP